MQATRFISLSVQPLSLFGQPHVSEYYHVQANRISRGGKFKNRYSRQSIQFPQGVRVDVENHTIFLPKLKHVALVLHRKFEGVIKTVTVSKTRTGKYFVSILVENQASVPAKKPITQETTVGVDMGVQTLATLSDGTRFENIRTLRTNLKRLEG